MSEAGTSRGAALLVLNAGSSSIKFAMFDAAVAAGDGLRRAGERLRGEIDGIGDRPRLKARNAAGRMLDEAAVDLDSKADGNAHEQAIFEVLGCLERHAPDVGIIAVGHRVVHGGPDLAEPLVLDAASLAELERLVPLAPLHQPHNLAGIRAAMRTFPRAAQVACFDTAFHRRQPWVADTFALPRRFFDQGVRRYGFHGLSYDFISRYLRHAYPALSRGRVVIAHLGNGASLCAVQDGRPMGSTMGFTALDGMPMGTRTGQLDPGVVLHLLRAEGMTADAIETLLYKESGLLGLSGISGDWRRLEAAGTTAAADAMAYFTHRLMREIGGLAATMGGLDALIFTAGIGEHAIGLRRTIGHGLAWFGLEIDDDLNDRHGEIISTPTSRAAILVLPTDEEAVIAGYTRGLIAKDEDFTR